MFLLALYWIGSCSLPYFWQMLLPYFGRCYCHCFWCGRCYNQQADVVPYVFVADFVAIWCILLWQMLLPLFIVWLVLLPFDVCCYDCVADVIAAMNDGIAFIHYLADVIAIWCVLIWFCGRCYCHYGWWYYHLIQLMWLCGRCYYRGCRWNSLPRWVWIMVRCYNHRCRWDGHRVTLFLFQL